MKGRRVRLFLRLTTDVNDRLRALMRYHGELSRYIDDALTSLDLASIELMPVRSGGAREESRLSCPALRTPEFA